MARVDCHHRPPCHLRPLLRTVDCAGPVDWHNVIGGETLSNALGSDDSSPDDGKFFAALPRDQDKDAPCMLGGGIVIGPQEPSTAQEDLAGPDADGPKAVMEEEIEQKDDEPQTREADKPP